MAAIKRVQINKSRKAVARLKPIQSPKAEFRKKSEIQSPKIELLVGWFILRISGFGLLSDLGHRLCRVLVETEFIGVSTFRFMLPQRLACLFRAALAMGLKPLVRLAEIALSR
jgi:hypothetical protein